MFRNFFESIDEIIKNLILYIIWHLFIYLFFQMQLYSRESFLSLPSNHGLFSVVLNSLVGANDTFFFFLVFFWDPSHVCDLHHSSRQHRIVNPPSKGRDRTRNLMVPSRIHFCCATTGTPNLAFI